MELIPNGDRIIKRRFPRDVVISLSSSCPTQVKSRSARSRPISSHVCRIAERGYIIYRDEPLGTDELRTSVTTAFVTLLGPTSGEGNVGLGRLGDPVICNRSGVFTRVFAFKEEDLCNSTWRIHPIELEKLLKGRLGLTRWELGEIPRRSDTNHQSNCSTTWLRGRRSDNPRGRRTNFCEGVCQERDD